MNAPNFYSPIDGAISTLAASHAIGSLTLSVATGDAAKFGSPSPSSPIRVTVLRASDGARCHYSVTGRLNNVLTISGVIDGYSDLALSIGDKVGALVSAGTIQELQGGIIDTVDALNAIQLTPGPQGALGFQGSAGVQGFQGSQGATGTQGFQGSPGAASTAPGPQGSPGVQGASGQEGDAGAQGAQGAQGYQGAAGSGGGFSTPAGANGSVQYNNNGVLGGSLLVTGSTYPVEIGGSIEIDTVGNIQLFGGNSSVTTIGSTLKLGQTGGQFGSSFLTLTNGIGANGAVFSTVSPYALVDFGFLTSANIQSNFRYECRAGSVISSGNGTYGEFEFVMNSTGGTFYFPFVFGEQDAIFYPQVGGSGAGYYPGRVGVRVNNPQAAIHVQTQANEVAEITEAASGQTADLKQWQDSSGNVLSGVDAKGYIRSVVGSGAPTSTPPDGSMYLDNTNGSFYVRTQSTWKKATLS